MTFNSFSYFLFLPVIYLTFYFTPDSWRWLTLLLGSFIFYFALKAPHLIVVLLLVTTITYFVGIWLEKNKNPRTRKYILWGGISSNVLTLVTLKYLSYLSMILPGAQTSVSKAITTVGVSYFIFQAISYLIDIYLEIEKPERHVGHFALYLSFFPKLLQGPIERGGDLLHQFKIPYFFCYNNIRSGMLLFAIGLLKKVVIADRLALMVNPVFDNVYAHNGISLLIATYYYALQIYFDFSGYTDMALGTAKMFNINLTQNFNNPYFSTSIADFWRRWHISFSRWILDYIFKPLQMSWRNWGSCGIATALLVTFTISGIWHGASWGFVAWGMLHGIYLALSIAYKPYQKKVHKFFKIDNKSIFHKALCVFFIFNLVSLAWIFFRTSSVKDAFFCIRSILKDIPITLYNISLHDFLSRKIDFSLGYGYRELFVCIVFIASVGFYDMYIKDRIFEFKLLFRWSAYYILLAIIVFFSVSNIKKDFIYLAF